MVKTLAFILKNTDPIEFFLKEDHPLRCSLRFKKLGNTQILFYFAPRAEKETDEDQEDWEEMEF
jgi:hypothetical protein